MGGRYNHLRMVMIVMIAVMVIQARELSLIRNDIV
jgi:hypothetical protein